MAARAKKKISSLPGIVSFGAYIPKYRLGKETVGWGMAEKAVANFDEDSITMAVAAGMDCTDGRDRGKIDALFFATTTSPYLEKQAATTVATALDLRRELRSADFTNVLRAGTTAIRSGLDAIASGTARNVMVSVADMRMAAPKGDYDRNFGDGAAALLLGNADVAVEVEGSHFITDQMIDVWRAEGDPFVRSWEERFVQEEGYQRVMLEGISGLMQKFKLTPKDISKAVFYGPDPRRHAAMGKRLGFDPTQIQDPLFGSIGNTGAAFPIMILVAALEEAKPGDRILLASYGDGCDVLLLRVTENIKKIKGRRGVKKHLQSKKVILNYDTVLRWRDLTPSEAARRPPPTPPSVSALWRDRDQIIRLYGVKCNACGTLQYPPQRVCTICRVKDDFEIFRFSDKKGKVFTYSMDYLAGTIDTPLVITIINFDCGGRMLCMMTDREIDEVRIDMPVEMSFRKLRSVGGIHNYYWKSVPIRV